MTRLDFHSISTILLNHLKAADISQMDYMYYLFASFINDEKTDLIFDNGLVCHWIKGKMRISPKIVQYYIPQEHIDLMKTDISKELFPFISDTSKTAEEIKALLLFDTSISDNEKQRIISAHNDDSDTAIAAFIGEAMIFGMSRAFVKAGSNIPTSTSPLIEDIIITTATPKPVNTFTGRESELQELHELLAAHHHVFLRGIPGIGKSELAKQYIKTHKKDFTNILYLEYTGSLYEMIADLDFADDTIKLSEKERFHRHYRFLKTLKADSLIVIDNFNITSTEESMTSQFCSLKCNVLFTTRNNLSSGYSYKIHEDKSLALSVFQNSCKKDAPTFSQEQINILLEKISYHTMSAELLGRLLSYNVFSYEQINTMLTDNVLLPQDESKIILSKDNNNTKSVFKQHFLKLLNYEALSTECQHVLSLIALAPEIGFPITTLVQISKNNINTLNELEEIGLVATEHGLVHMNPYIRKIVNAGKYASTSQYQDVFNHFISKCDSESPDRVLFYLQLIDTATLFLVKDDFNKWIRIIRCALEMNTRLNRYRSFSRLLSEYEYLCYKTDFIVSDDQYMLYHFKAIESANIRQNINKAIELEERAIYYAGKNGTTNVHNFSTLYLDAGKYYHMLGNLQKSMEYTKKSAGILRETQTLYSPNGVASLMQYARLLYEKNDFKEAIQIYSNCLGVIGSVYGKSNLTYGYISQNLAALYSGLGNNKLAAFYFNKAITILEDALGDEHPDVLLCKSQVQKLSSTNAICLLDSPTIATQFIA